MNRLTSRLLLSCVAMLLGSSTAFAQSTDGYHSIQIFPVVVDSSTFQQRFFFTNSSEQPVTVQARFYPGDGTAQAGVGPVTCNSVVIPAVGKTVVASLRTLCPAMVAGSAFGYLYTNETSPSSIPYAGYSRVSNFGGAGFSVEAFPAHTFTSADSTVSGIRRLAATGSTPAYQTNCFLANLNENVVGGDPNTTVAYSIYNSTGTVIGGSQVVLPAGRLVRLLDVFAAAGLPPGDYNDADVLFQATSGYGRGLMTFCTVQDNTSFGADFRISKQAFGSWGEGSEDGHVVRTYAWEDQDLYGHLFQIGAGNSANTHTTLFRHPDYVSCSLLNPADDTVLPASSGLEMRLLHMGNVIAGGNNVTSFGEIYLGDKEDKDGGANSAYSIEVESNEQNTGAVRSYALYCQSGSGHPGTYSVVKYKEAIDRF